jgi:hypothetical protein
MKMSNFESLSQKNQITILYQHGVYIGKKRQGQFVKLLFQLDSFYVELSYTSYRRSIDKIHCSDSLSILDPYLEQITIEYLVT